MLEGALSNICTRPEYQGLFVLLAKRGRESFDTTAEEIGRYTPCFVGFILLVLASPEKNVSQLIQTTLALFRGMISLRPFTILYQLLTSTFIFISVR